MITEAEDEDDMKMNTTRERDHCFEQDQLLQSAVELNNGQPLHLSPVKKKNNTKITKQNPMLSSDPLQQLNDSDQETDFKFYAKTLKVWQQSSIFDSEGGNTGQNTARLGLTMRRKTFENHPKIIEMKLKAGQLSRKMNRLGLQSENLDDTLHSIGGDTTDQSHPHQFPKNALGLNEVREIFTTRDFKRIKLAHKRNSQPFANTHGAFKTKRSITGSKGRYASKRVSRIDGDGLILDAWPVDAITKNSVFSLDPSNRLTFDSSLQVTGNPSVETLQNAEHGKGLNTDRQQHDSANIFVNQGGLEIDQNHPVLQQRSFRLKPQVMVTDEEKQSELPRSVKQQRNTVEYQAAQQYYNTQHNWKTRVGSNERKYETEFGLDKSKNKVQGEKTVKSPSKNKKK